MTRRIHFALCLGLVLLAGASNASALDASVDAALADASPTDASTPDALSVDAGLDASEAGATPSSTSSDADTDAGRIWASCMEHIPEGATRPKLENSPSPDRGKAGYALAFARFASSMDLAKRSCPTASASNETVTRPRAICIGGLRASGSGRGLRPFVDKAGAEGQGGCRSGYSLRGLAGEAGAPHPHAAAHSHRFVACERRAGDAVHNTARGDYRRADRERNGTQTQGQPSGATAARGLDLGEGPDLRGSPGPRHRCTLGVALRLVAQTTEATDSATSTSPRLGRSRSKLSTSCVARTWSARASRPNTSTASPMSSVSTSAGDSGSMVSSRRPMRCCRCCVA